MIDVWREAGACSWSNRNESLLQFAGGTEGVAEGGGPLQRRCAAVAEAGTETACPPKAAAPISLAQAVETNGPGRILRGAPAAGLHRPVDCAMKERLLQNAPAQIDSLTVEVRGQKEM